MNWYDDALDMLKKAGAWTAFILMIIAMIGVGCGTILLFITFIAIGGGWWNILFLPTMIFLMILGGYGTQAFYENVVDSY